MTTLLEALLTPRTIAIVGASPRLGFAGRGIVNLTTTGYAGTVYPVNPRYAEVAGHRCHATIADVPEPVDLAYLILPADRVVEAARQCVDAGVRAAVVCASGFAEVGAEGARRQEQLTELASVSGMRLLGPNCIGVANFAGNVIGVPTFNLSTEVASGDVTVLSQSGGAAVTLANRAQARGIGLRALMTLGNEADLDLAAVLDLLADDPLTRVVAMFMERLRDGRAFARAVAKAREAGMHLVALKVGKSPQGQATVAGHTGALAGEPMVYRGVLRQLGVLEVDTVDELLNAAHVLSVCPRPSGDRVGILTISGGESSYLADLATRRGLQVTPLSEATATAIGGVLSLVRPQNPVDLSGQVIGDGAATSAVLGAFVAEPSFDLIAIATPTWARTEAEEHLPRFMAALKAVDRPAVLCSWSAGALTARAEELLTEAPVPVFTSSDEGVTALSDLVRGWRLRDRAGALPEPDEALRVAPPAHGTLGEAAAMRLLRDHGFPTVAEVLVTEARAAAEAFTTLGGGVVLKLQATGLLHKTEVNGLRLDVRDAPGAAQAYRELEAVAEREDLAFEGVLVAERARGVEVIVGATHDPTFGPVVLLGGGGVWAELLGDVTFRAAPLRAADAADAVDELRVGAVLRGGRGADPDLPALLDLLERLGQWFAANAEWVVELDCNPVIVGERGHGAVIADALLTTRAR